MSNSISNGKVPMGQKIAFGLGMLANQMFPAALGIFMVVLVQDLGFPTWMWGVLFFLPRIFDSITDPIMGFISDNTKSKWGRRRHYVFIGAIIMAISFILMWQLERADGITYNFYYFLLWSLMFYLGLTIFSVPYVAMGYEMSNDFHERTSIMAVSQWIGQWAWVIAPWFWVVMYDPSWFSSADVAAQTLAIWVGVGCGLLAIVPAIFIKSESTINDDNLKPLTMKNIGSSFKEIIKGFQEAFKLEPFRKLCIATFFIFNAFNTVASFSFFIIVYYLFNGDAGAAWIWPTLFGSIGALATTFLVIPIVARMSKMMGKKNAFLTSQGISIFGYILLWFLFVPGKPYLFLIALPFFSFGIGGLFTLMMSMTADVCDLDELNFGHRREGIFGAIYWWMVKFGFAIAGGLSGLIMYLVDFTPNAPTQPDGAVDGLRLFFSAFPIAGTLIAMYVMRNYDITEKRAMEISAELAKRKANKNIESSSYIPGKLKSLLNNNVTSFGSSELNLKNESDLKILYSEMLNKGLHGLCFSPYVEGQQAGDILTADQIKRRLDIITPHTNWIRSFSCTEGNELIPEIAHQKGLKTVVGAWISDDRVRNEKEIDTLIKLAKSGLVDIAAVGNEVLHRNEISEQELITYLKRVKEAVPSIPVAYVDAYYQFLDRPDLVSNCDVLLVNFYPFWEGANNDFSLSYLQNMMELTQTISKGKKIIIAETGWPSKGENVQEAIPSEINAMKYFIASQEWAKSNNIELFYFSSFDESWKVKQEGTVGTAWGIWDKNEKLKFELKTDTYVI
ncbi:MAG TPA: MFS transporter [Flavobacterium sp.]|uniref:MFS transporter n=1 Tax=unclassified Flavobacterium TaxID=196869 RepID=UPI000E8C6447|nr:MULTISPECIES: MFS transporter [unclassified Flavobacterium]HBI01359.1 glycosyl hydrolase [Flavobacterium sp.]HRE78406.1 MFS transporter [Flavobacterium sp.]